MFDEVADADPSLGNEPSTNAVDPDFEIPSEWKVQSWFHLGNRQRLCIPS